MTFKRRFLNILRTVIGFLKRPQTFTEISQFKPMQWGDFMAFLENLNFNESRCSMSRLPLFNQSVKFIFFCQIIMWHKTLYDSIYRIGTENRWRFNLQFGALILLCALQVVKIPISVIIDELIALLESSGLDCSECFVAITKGWFFFWGRIIILETSILVR